MRARSTGTDTGLAHDTHASLETGETAPLLPHECVLKSTRWRTLEAFLAACAAALHEQDGCAQKSSAASASPACKDCQELKKAALKANRPRRGSGTLVIVLDRAFPAATSVAISFVGHCQAQRLLNPAAPHPWVILLRYLAIMAASVLAVLLGVVILRGIMVFCGVAVCASADALQRALSAAAVEEKCQPMLPDGWLLPGGFAVLGAYITVQIAWLCGITIRHTFLNWDRCAWKAVALWFAVCVAYTAFVYTARLLLTMLVVLTAPSLECAASLQEAGIC